MGMGKTPENPTAVLEGRRPQARITEAQKMRGILHEYEPRLGNFELVQVGDAGWILKRQSHVPKLYPGVIVTCDVDDTLIQSSQIKLERKKRYSEFLHHPDRHVEIADPIVDALMNITYGFVQGRVGQGNYLTDNHAVVLDWVTSELQTAQAEGQSDIDAASKIVATLGKMGDHGFEDHDPFVIQDGVLTSKNPSEFLPALQQMFQDTLTQTPPYQNTVDAVGELVRRRDLGANINVNLLTQGYPPEQLLKVLGLLDRNPDMKVDHIFITKVYKDTFIKELVETESMKKLSDYQDKEDGYIFGKYDHTVVGVDDSIHSLNAQAQAIPFLTENTGAKMRLVRLRRRDTKDGQSEWEKRGEHREIDLREEELLGVDLATKILDEAQAPVQRRAVIPEPRPGEPSHVKAVI